MTTTKSYSDRSRFSAMYRTALRHQIPFAIIAAILFGLIIPLVFFVAYINQDFSPSGSMAVNASDEIARFFLARFSSGVYVDDAQSAVVIVALIALSLIGALVQTGYMQSKKKTDLFHALPIRRGHLLSANLLASLTATLVPFLSVYLLTMAAQLLMFGRYILGSAIYFQYIGMDLLCCIVTAVVVYAFTAFVAVNVGTEFDSFALTAMIGALPLSLFAITNLVWQNLTYGADFYLAEVVLLFSPFTFPFQRYFYIQDIRNTLEISNMRSMITVLLVWLLIGAALYLLAVRCYDRRKSEIAEQTQPGGVFQIIAKCFAAFFGGAIFFAIFFESGNMVAWILAIFAGALVIGTVAELILSRGVRSLLKNLKWFGGAAALLCLLVAVVRLDITGYVAHVPAVDSVESVTVQYRGRFDTLSGDIYIPMRGNEVGYNDGNTTLTDPESIGIVLDAHRLAVENQPPEVRRHSYIGPEEPYSYSYITLEYTMKNGKKLHRNYTYLSNDALLRLADLEDKDEFIRQNHAIFFMDAYAKALGGTDAASYVNTITLFNDLGSGGHASKLPESDTRRVLEAARQDMLDESLTDIHQPDQPALGYMSVLFELPLDGGANPYYVDSTVIIGSSYSNTIAVLTELGLLNSVADTSEIARIEFVPASYISEDYRVLALTPGNAYQTDYRYYYGDTRNAGYESTSDPAEIAAILEASRNQFLRQRLSADGRGLYVINCYDSQNQLAGERLVHSDSLPESLQSQLYALYTDEARSEPDFEVSVQMG